MPKTNGTFVRSRIMMVTDDGSDAIDAALTSLVESAEAAGYKTQIRKLATQIEFRFVRSASHLVKAPLTPEEAARRAKEQAIRAISRTLGREVSEREYDEFVAKFGK